MPEALEDLVMMQPPTANRPLLGTMVLVVEDSRHACEALRLICQRSGARIRRAGSLASAERHLRTYRPRIAVIDLGLPDGSGLELIAKMAEADARIDGIIASSGDESLKDAAIGMGADAFLPKPISSIAHFQKTVLGLLPEDAQPVRVARPAVDEVAPDVLSLRDDLALACELLRTSPGPDTLAYLVNFLLGLAKCTRDPLIGESAADLAALQDGAHANASLLEIANALDARAQHLGGV